jgi:hypothetical protein
LWSQRAQGIYRERGGLEGGARKDNHTAPRQQGRRDTGTGNCPKTHRAVTTQVTSFPSRKHREGILEGILRLHPSKSPALLGGASAALTAHFDSMGTALVPGAGSSTAGPAGADNPVALRAVSPLDALAFFAGLRVSPGGDYGTYLSSGRRDAGLLCCYHGSACTEHATLAAHLWTLEPFYGFSVTF